jgi:tetratricopeptide (TPR) repeat protein
MYEDAIVYLDKALAIDPNSVNVDALYNKGAALLDQGKNEEAIEYFDRVLAIEPNATDAADERGVALIPPEKSQYMQISRRRKRRRSRRGWR